jgi:hypothetical protein
MPWNWNGGSKMDVRQGGSRGSVEESKVPAAWPEYEADYLKRRLRTGVEKWDSTGLQTLAQKTVYLQEVAKNHKAEAEECLKSDFKLWLEGRHPVYNDPNREYEGQAPRRHVYRTSDGENRVTEPMDNWKATPWGTDQLTHLPGVRQFLRDELEEGEKQTLHMNLLAEHGPQTLEEAWMYFKHWVAERPLSEAQCEYAVDPGRGPIGDHGNKALFGNMPHHMKNEGARAAPPGGAPGGAPPRRDPTRPRFTPRVAPSGSRSAPMDTSGRGKRSAETTAEGDTSRVRFADEVGAPPPAAVNTPLPPQPDSEDEGGGDGGGSVSQDFRFQDVKPFRFQEVKVESEPLGALTASERREERKRVLARANAYEQRFLRSAGVDYTTREIRPQRPGPSRSEYIAKQAAAAYRYAQEEPRRAAATGYTRIVDPEGLREVDAEKRDQLGINIEGRLRGGKARRQANADDDPSLKTRYPEGMQEPDTSAFKE